MYQSPRIRIPYLLHYNLQFAFFNLLFDGPLRLALQVYVQKFSISMSKIRSLYLNKVSN